MVETTAPEFKDSEALEACRSYLEEAVEFLTGKRTNLPNPGDLAERRFSRSTILNARATGPDRFNRELPFIAAEIADRAEPDRERKERYFDPWYFAAISLMEIPGRFHFDRSKKIYHYLSYIGPELLDGNFYLRRIICDTPWWADTREDRETEEAHYDYRRATLKWVGKSRVRKLGQKTHSASRTRDDALKFAAELFERQIRAHGTDTLPHLNIDHHEYTDLLSMAFGIADAVNEKFLMQRAFGAPIRPHPNN